MGARSTPSATFASSSKSVPVDLPRRFSADEEFDFEELLSRWGCDYDEDDDTPLTDEQICERLGLVTD
jgi:hypothetical protein